MSINFCTIASGSSGNSVFVSTPKTKILIDAGISGKTIESALGVHGINCAALSAIFVTHEHVDHIRGIGVLSRRYNLPIYATAGTWDYISRLSSLGKIVDANRLFITPGIPVHLDDMKITPFDIPHDANQPVGFTIVSESHKIAMATDLGHISDTVAKNILGADIILIESNHDLAMLASGPYPLHLKHRIASDTGHLSNAACGRFLADIFSPKTKHIFLGHLSKENNRPILAYETVKNILIANNIDAGGSVGLYLANHHKPSSMLTLS